MQETLRQLVELQRLDDAIERVQRAIGALPGEREAIELAEQTARERVEQAHARVEELRLELRHAESGLQDQEALKGRLDGQQSQVKSNEAYTALLHEIEAATHAISESETRILEGMDRVQEALEAARAAETEQARSKTELAQRRRALEERSEQLDRERRSLDEARSSLAAALEPDALGRYERIAVRRRPAVAIVENQVCMGCRVGIPPQLHVELISGKQLLTCSSCRRILVLARYAAPAQDATQPGEIGT